MTGHPGIFAGGDVIGGPRTMTAATGHGKKAARAIDAWLRGETYAAPAKHPPVDFGMLNLPLYPRRRPHAHERAAGRGAHAASPRWSPASRQKQARYEADRCLSCGNCFECDNCFAACPEQAIVKLGKGRKYIVNLDLCTGCAICYDQCPCHAIEMVAEPQTTAPRSAASASRSCPTRFKLRA